MKDGAPAGGGGHGLPVVRVRKYGNRRMYDLERKQYVALDEVARLVRDGRAVRVEDVSTGEDVTRATLVQALVEARGLARFLSDGAVVGLLRLDDARLGEVLGGELERVLEGEVRAVESAAGEAAREPEPVIEPAQVAREEAPAARVPRGPVAPSWPAPVWPAPGVVGFGQGPPAGVYGAQPASSPQGLSEEVRSLRGEIDALRGLLERAVRGGK